MTRSIFVLVAVCLLGALPGHAQTTGVPPGAAGARNGNVYNGTSHEPSAPSVSSAEHSAGVAPSAQKAQQENQELERLNQQLQQQQGVKNPAPIQ